jgi:signal transduction histidine kinase
MRGLMAYGCCCDFAPGEREHGRVWVRDQGPGIPPSEQARLWERFHHVPGIEVQYGSGVGLGLGLHICQTIIDHHHGQVGVESQPRSASVSLCAVVVQGYEVRGDEGCGFYSSSIASRCGAIRCWQRRMQEVL